MKLRRKKIFRGVALAFAIAAFTASTAQAKPTPQSPQSETASAAASYTPRQLRALELRSQGMNARYISATPTLTEQQLRRLVTRFQGTNVGFGLTGSTASGVHTSAAATPALTAQQLEQELRFQGVDKRNGLTGQTETSVQSSSPSAVTSSGDGMTWRDGFAGAAAVFATAIILVVGFTAMRRREHPVSV